MCMMPDKTRYNYEMPLRSKTKIKNSLKNYLASNELNEKYKT